MEPEDRAKDPRRRPLEEAGHGLPGQTAPAGIAKGAACLVYCQGQEQ